MFCAAYNLKKLDSAVVEVDVEQDMEKKRSWWGKNGRRTDKKKRV